MKKFVVILISIIIFLVLTITLILNFFPRKFRSEIEKYSDKFGLSASLVASVINVESRYDELAVSKVGAIGLMQLLPSTANECANKLNFNYDKTSLFDIETNINLGCYYLSYLLDKYNGNIINALCAYNWGYGNVNEWISLGNVDKSGTITNIPVKETRNYISKFKVCNFIYKKIYKY